MVYSKSRLRRQSQNEDELKIEDDVKNEDDLKNENNLKNEDDLKKIICPPYLREYYLNFFWWPFTSTATGQLILKRKWYQVFKTETGKQKVLLFIALFFFFFWQCKTNLSFGQRVWQEFDNIWIMIMELWKWKLTLVPPPPTIWHD